MNDGSRCQIPVYIMVNMEAKNEITTFFEENENFGLKASNVMVFQQSISPVLDQNGYILLREKHAMAAYPSGTGGVFHAMQEYGLACLHLCTLHVAISDQLLQQF